MSNPPTGGTPTSSRTAALSHSYHSGPVEGSRDVFLKDTPEIAEVVLNSLLSGVTPAVSPSVENQVYDRLAESNFVDETRPRWTSMTVDPKSSGVAEGVAFESVRTIFGQVLSAANIQNSLVKLDLDGSNTLDSKPSNASRPDAYLQLSTSSFHKPDPERDHWVDVVMPIEFKKELNDSKFRDDARKLVWQMHHIMRCDPRRRFVFGMTIENTSARFWFHDRCDIVVSTIFDIHKDWKVLARIFLRLASASPQELGFDTGCTAVPNELYQYDFTFLKEVDGISIENVYRTVGIISDLGATGLIGQGTRVWRVLEVEGGQPGGEFHALKDVWPHDDREAEHVVVQKVKETHKDDAKYFLTVLNAEFVLVLHNGKLISDNTFGVIRRGVSFVVTGVKLKTSVSQSASNTSSQTQGKGRTGSRGNSRGNQQNHTSGSHPLVVEAAAARGHRDVKYLNLYPRRHYRMVALEAGESVYYIRNFPNALNAIRDASKGLNAIHRTGYNHRDVSAGNIISYQGPADDGPRGIIMDLEYAKGHNVDSDSHDVKTGTAAFMAVEVSHGDYRYKQPSRVRDAEGELVPDPIPAFHQNSLHDYESIWWIVLWLVFCLFEPDRRRTDAFISNYELVFKSSADIRWAFWDQMREFSRRSKHLDNKPEKKYLAAMADWAGKLQDLYKESYSADQFKVQASATIQEAHQLELDVLGELIEIVSSYPDNLAYFMELEVAPPPPDSPILPMASLRLEPSHSSLINQATSRPSQGDKQQKDAAALTSGKTA